jgi:hypothetical protein
MPIKPSKLALQPRYDIRLRDTRIPELSEGRALMKPIFYDPENDKIIDRTPKPEEINKTFSDILKPKK